MDFRYIDHIFYLILISSAVCFSRGQWLACCLEQSCGTALLFLSRHFLSRRLMRLCQGIRIFFFFFLSIPMSISSSTYSALFVTILPSLSSPSQTSPSSSLSIWSSSCSHCHCHHHHHHLYLIYQSLLKVQIKAFLSSLMGLQYVSFSFSC